MLKYGSTHNGALTDLFSVCGGGRRGWMGGAWVDGGGQCMY